MNKRLKAPLLAALLSLYGCEDTAESFPAQIPKPAIQETRIRSLEERLKETASEKTKVRIEDFSVSPFVYPQEDLPFDGYRHGPYLRAKSSDGNHRVYFSQRGDYIGRAFRVKGEKDNWIAETTDSKGKVMSREKYRYHRGHVTIYSDFYQDDGNIRRWLSEPQVYKVSQNQLIKDKPYRGSFGGDGEHYIEDRGYGKFFVVTEQILNPQSKVTYEIGKFFVVKGKQGRGDPECGGSLDNYACSAEVKRKAGSKKLEPNFGTAGLDKLKNQKEVYNRFIPTQMQVKF